MNGPQSSPAETRTVPLAPGASFYQVLMPGKILAANGDPQYEMSMPIGDLGSASALSQRYPGSLISVTLILFQNQQAAPTVIQPMKKP